MIRPTSLCGVSRLFAEAHLGGDNGFADHGGAHRSWRAAASGRTVLSRLALLTRIVPATHVIPDPRLE